MPADGRWDLIQRLKVYALQRQEYFFPWHKVLCKEESSKETNEPSLLIYFDNTTSPTPREIIPEFKFQFK